MSRAPYSADVVARRDEPTAEPRKPTVPEPDSRAALDALDRLQASLRDRGVDLYRWERDLLAQRRAAGLRRLPRRP